MKKTILFLAVFIVMAALITGCANKQTEPKVIGGDKDAGGCLVGAGYSWCEAKQKCIRVWEENCTSCGECPQFSPPAPGWCSDGNIVSGEKDSCGCQGHPTCVKACTQEAKLCPDGSSVGRTGPNCEFADCPANTQGDNSTVHVCTAEESQQTACTLEYMPVCGKIVLNMGDTKYQTFGNKCAACAAMKVVSYVPGECANSSVG